MLPSDMFGRVFAQTSHVAIEAATDATVCCYNRASFEHLFTRFPELEHRMLAAISRELDAAFSALVTDLDATPSKHSPGKTLLDETLVIWGGEFGRTIYSQGALTKDTHGRDHHGRCFTLWMAGGGVKPGASTARRTTTATTSSRTRSTSTTYRRRSCTASASTTSG